MLARILLLLYFITEVNSFSVTTPSSTTIKGSRQGLSQEWKTIFAPSIRPVTVLPSPVSNFERGVVVHEQPHQLGPLYSHRMRHAVYRLNDGSVVCYNPIAPTQETMQVVCDTYGKDPDFFIIPTNSYEHLVMVKGWAERFPKATFYGLPGVDLEGVNIRKDLMEDGLPREWNNEFDVAVLNGCSIFKECYWLHKPTRTVFSIDSFNQITEEFIGNSIGQKSMEILGTFGTPSCSTRFFLLNRDDNRRTMKRVLSWDFDTVISTHGVIPIQDGKAAIANAFSFLFE